MRTAYRREVPYRACGYDAHTSCFGRERGCDQVGYDFALTVPRRPAPRLRSVVAMAVLGSVLGIFCQWTILGILRCFWTNVGTCKIVVALMWKRDTG